MFGYIVKTIILTIFAIIILHFTIEHTKIICIYLNIQTIQFIKKS